jgi:uncharacterized protein (DUF302 family)
MMMETKMYFRLESDKPFDTVVSNLEKQVPEHKFRVLAVHDVQATLAEKELERGPLKIIEVCNAVFAHEALGKTSDVALFMPCRYTVYTEGEKTVLNLARPSMIAEMMPHAGLAELAGSVEETLKSIMAKSV